MTGASLGSRTASYGSLQQQSQKGVLHIRATSIFVRKNTKPLTSLREKEKCRHFICCHFGLRKVAVLLLVALAILVFVFGTYTGSRGMLYLLRVAYILSSLSYRKVDLCVTFFLSSTSYL